MASDGLSNPIRVLSGTLPRSLSLLSSQPSYILCHGSCLVGDQLNQVEGKFPAKQKKEKGQKKGRDFVGNYCLTGKHMSKVSWCLLLQVWHPCSLEKRMPWSRVQQLELYYVLVPYLCLSVFVFLSSIVTKACYQQILATKKNPLHVMSCNFPFH